jgi:hypothetical protein
MVKSQFEIRIPTTAEAHPRMNAAAVHHATFGSTASLVESRQWNAALSPMRSAPTARATTNHCIYCSPVYCVRASKRGGLRPPLGASTAQRIIAKNTRNRSAQSFASNESHVRRQMAVANRDPRSALWSSVELHPWRPLGDTLQKHATFL